MMPTNVRSYVLAGLLVQAAAGCADPGAREDALSLGRSVQAVLGGTLSPPERDAVVLLAIDREDGDWGDCSGTLVTPQIVITARHCVSALNPGPFICDKSGDAIDDGTGAGTFGDAVTPSSVAVYLGAIPGAEPAARGARIYVTDSSHACRDDFALVVLDRSLPLPSLPPIRRSKPTVAGERVTLVGYGRQEAATEIVRKEVAGVRIVEVGATSNGLPNEAATTPPRTFVVPGATLCFGDSGGPALADSSGAVLGVYSRITGDCFAPESRNTFALVQSFQPLIETALADTGEGISFEIEQSADAGAAGASQDAGKLFGDAAGAAPEQENAGRSHAAFRCNMTRTGFGRSRGAGAFLLLLAVGLCFSARRSFSAF